MKRVAIWIATLIFVLLLVFLLVRKTRQPDQNVLPLPAASPSQATPGNVDTVENTSSQPLTSPNQPALLLGETILRGYANTNLPPQNDLTLMSRLMDNALLLSKAAVNHPLSANEDWADLLRGKNGAIERFLPDSHPALNAKGQLIDRWGTPLFFHAVGGGRFDIRSAGPDRKLWTDDDIHRNANGSFRHGPDLNPPALF